MKLIGTIRVDVTSEAPEACDFLLKSIVRGINRKLIVYARDAGGVLSKARVQTASITRVRPAARAKKKAAR